MVSRQIIVFKCVVNICNQDFGAFCHERDLGEKKRFGEHPGATKHAPGWSLDALVDHGARAGKVNWASWAVLAVLVGGQLAGGAAVAAGVAVVALDRAVGRP